MKRLETIQVGPHKLTFGGTQSVIRIIQRERIGADRVRVLATWNGPKHALAAVLVARAALAFALVDRDTIVHFHISNGGAWLREGSLILFAHALGLRVVVTLHGYEMPEFARAHPRFARSILRRADHIICLSREGKEVVEEVVGQGNVSVLANPVAIDRASPPGEQTPPVVLFAGAIGYRKGVDVLIEAWREILARGVPGELHIVGPDEDFDVPSLDRVVVRGPVHPNDIPALLRTVRVVVLPSRAEAMPMILTEALAAGRPFIATPVGGVASITPDPGMLVPVGDAKALADAIERYLVDEHCAGEAGRLGQQHIVATRSPEVIGEQLRNIYLGVAR